MTTSFCPCIAATRKPLNLSMQRLWLTGQVLPAGARLVVQHVFRSEEDTPLEVIYSFPLPRDAALRRFRITGDGFEAHSELKPTETAVKAYEQGLAQGSLSTLVRQYRDGLVNLTVGNIRPKETVTVYLEILCGVESKDDGFRFRFPFTLAPAYHSLAKALATAPGEGELELPPNQFGDLILPRFREDARALHQVGFDLSLTGALPLDEIGSPSHVVKVRRHNTAHSSSISLNAEKDIPNRDLVLDAHFQSIAPQILAGRRNDGKGHFAAILPSSTFGSSTEAPRRVVILLDRSGSMQGAAISQARKAIAACLAVLSEADSFGLVAFDNQAEMFQPTLVSGTRANRDAAEKFLTSVDARGGTELANGFRQASTLLNGKGGDILILTDGQVSGTDEILAAARATSVRLHCLGIGSASQDRFLTLLSRETGGVSRFVTPRERVDLSAVDLFASIGRPIASELKASPNIQPEPSPIVFSGTPVLLFGQDNEIELNWQGGSLTLPVEFTDDAIAETVYLLQGARLITDWESRYPSTEALAPLEKRKESRVAARLLSLSETYGLASREMSLVSVVTRPGDRPGELPETHLVPVGMPQDTAFGSYFNAHLSQPPSEFTMAFASAPVGAPRAHPSALMPKGASLPTPPPPSASQEPLEILMHRSGSNLAQKMPPKPGLFQRFLAGKKPPAAPAQQTPDDLLLTLAGRLESDGGLPGNNPDSRASATIVALLAFLSQGHTATNGAFRSHVARLVAFLKSLTGLSPDHQQLLAIVVTLNSAPPGDWLTLATASGSHWKQIARAVKPKGQL
jgi:Ca-activated chloride channel family protein